MRERKNSLLLFSKVPVPGMVKTRLTTLKDGILTPEIASTLYHCMLFDVVEICSAALADLEARPPVEVNGELIHDTYELALSTTPFSNVEVMKNLFYEAGQWPHEIVFVADEGTSFDEHYNDAFKQAFDRGADTILSMGVDMPALTKADIVGGFGALQRLSAIDSGGIVLSPDQEMGVSIIGWTRQTDFDHCGVFYNQEGLAVLPAYIAKARKQGLPALYLPPVPDVDTMADLRHAITIVEALEYCSEHDDVVAPWRMGNALREMGWSQVIVPPNCLFDPRDEIDK